MLAETPVTQHSPFYSAVSASLTNPLPDCSNIRHFATPSLSGNLLPDREDFKIHSVSLLLSEAPLARGSSALLSPCLVMLSKHSICEILPTSLRTILSKSDQLPLHIVSFRSLANCLLFGMSIRSSCFRFTLFLIWVGIGLVHSDYHNCSNGRL